MSQIATSSSKIAHRICLKPGSSPNTWPAAPGATLGKALSLAVEFPA
jgi:hypothetical protein